MAKNSVVARQNKRKLLVDKYRTKRTALKTTVKDKSLSFEERLVAMQKLAALPRDSNPIRLRNRCAITGRGRGVYRKFGLCRQMIRKYAGLGVIPGLAKASW